MTASVGSTMDGSGRSSKRTSPGAMDDGSSHASIEPGFAEVREGLSVPP